MDPQELMSPFQVAKHSLLYIRTRDRPQKVLTPLLLFSHIAVECYYLFVIVFV